MIDGYLVEDNSWNGTVVGFDWEAYDMIGNEPLPHASKSRQLEAAESYLRAKLKQGVSPKRLEQIRKIMLARIGLRP